MANFNYSFELPELKAKLQSLVSGRVIDASFDDLFSVSYPNVSGEERRRIVKDDNRALRAAGCLTRISRGHRSITIREAV